jgi:hypothetical protein
MSCLKVNDGLKKIHADRTATIPDMAISNPYTGRPDQFRSAINQNLMDEALAYLSGYVAKESALTPVSPFIKLLTDRLGVGKK